jgi:hypothetical protein
VGDFGNMYTVLWLRFFLIWLRFLLTLTEVFPCFFLSCKANARVKLAKTGHGPHSSTLVCICVVRMLFFCVVHWLIVLFCVVLVCKCVLPPGDNPIAVNKYYYYYNGFFFEIRTLHEVPCRNTLEPDRPQMKIRRMCIECWTSKATNTHRDYVTILAFPQNDGYTNAPQC